LYRCEKKEFAEKAIRKSMKMRDMLIDGFGGAIRKLLKR